MSIIRVVHNKDYVSINKKALEDPNLSFRAKGLWAYCMSRPNDWVFHASHLAKVSKENIDSIYTILKELENNGYLVREQIREKGKFKKTDYQIHEIQIILPQREKPDVVLPDTEKPTLLSIDINNDRYKKKEIYKEKDATSADASALADFFISEIKKRKPNFTKTVSPSWIKSFEKLLKLRTPEQIKAVILATIENEFWFKNVMSPDKILKHLDTLELLMNEESTDNLEENKKIIDKVYSTFINSKSVLNGSISRTKIQIGESFIHFTDLPDGYLKISDSGFADRVQLCLEKMRTLT